MKNRLGKRWESKVDGEQLCEVTELRRERLASTPCENIVRTNLVFFFVSKNELHLERRANRSDNIEMDG
jgi:hypothetical protein